MIIHNSVENEMEIFAPSEMGGSKPTRCWDLLNFTNMNYITQCLMFWRVWEYFQAKMYLLMFEIYILALA